MVKTMGTKEIHLGVKIEYNKRKTDFLKEIVQNVTFRRS